jgi:hypothetical protein
VGVLYIYLVIYTEEIWWNIKFGCVCVEYVHIHFLVREGRITIMTWRDWILVRYSDNKHIVTLMLKVNKFTERKFKSVNNKKIAIQNGCLFRLKITINHQDTQLHFATRIFYSCILGWYMQTCKMERLYY